MDRDGELVRRSHGSDRAQHVAESRAEASLIALDANVARGTPFASSRAGSTPSAKPPHAQTRIETKD